MLHGPNFVKTRITHKHHSIQIGNLLKPPAALLQLQLALEHHPHWYQPVSIFFPILFPLWALWAHFDTFYGLKMGQQAYKTLTMPNIAQKTPNFTIFPLFWVFFPPQTGQRPISPLPTVFWSIYIPDPHFQLLFEIELALDQLPLLLLLLAMAKV